MTRDAEADATMRLALGRILRLLSRPFEPGDVAQYENARSAFYAAHDASGRPETGDNRPNWARDRLRGAAGD